MSGKEHDIPDIIVARLPRYLRALSVLKEKGDTTNSKELGRKIKVRSKSLTKIFKKSKIKKKVQIEEIFNLGVQ